MDSKDHTGKWRYVDGLPFKGKNLQNSVVSYDKYLIVAGEDGEEQKEIYYFDVETEKWFDADGEIDSSVYGPSSTGSSGGPISSIPGSLCEFFNAFLRAFIFKTYNLKIIIHVKPTHLVITNS